MGAGTRVSRAGFPFEGRAGFHFRTDGDFHFFSKKAVVYAAAQRTREGPRSFGRRDLLATETIDMLGMHAVRAFQRGREEVIAVSKENCLNYPLRW